jgi:undecaprenyl-diphosphatase
MTRPWARLGLGLAGVLGSGLSVDSSHVGPTERAVFRRVNELPEGLARPAWVVMQAGTIGAVPAAAGLALATGRRGAAGRLLLSGTATWLLAKGVKRVYRRPRPSRLVAAARIRGDEATGMGYVSGHAGVAVAMALAAWPELPTPGRVAVLAVAPLVGTTRVYVGAHLPLDVVGGAALGLAVDGLVDVMGRRRSRPGR